MHHQHHHDKVFKDVCHTMAPPLNARFIVSSPPFAAQPMYLLPYWYVRGGWVTVERVGSVYFAGSVEGEIHSSTCDPYSLTTLQCQRVSNEACFRIHA